MKPGKSLLMSLLMLSISISFSNVSAQDRDVFPETELIAHMHEHLDRIGEIKAAIIAGDLEAARIPAAWLADHDAVAGLPAGWDAYLARMRNHAAAVVEAADFESAAIQLSMIAQACGECHVQNNSEVTFGFDQKPRDELDGRRTHMQRHLWGIDRMWDGLVGPSDLAWNRGSDFLIDIPLSPEELPDDTAEVDGIGDMAIRVHVLGGEGTQIKSAAGRSRLFGELLGLCGSCHSRLQVGAAY